MEAPNGCRPLVAITVKNNSKEQQQQEQQRLEASPQVILKNKKGATDRTLSFIPETARCLVLQS